jgi:metal-responsive CopG/Arc/MetJ family transcriptional regulator
VSEDILISVEIPEELKRELDKIRESGRIIKHFIIEAIQEKISKERKEVRRK